LKKEKIDSIRNRVFSFISAAIIGLNSMPMMTLSTANAASSASSSGSVMFPKNDADKSAKLNHDDTLVDNGDGTFTYTSKISASYSFSDTSKSRLQTTDDYYEFKKKGRYLIELWGGDGGDGGRAFLSGRNGLGGKGGFVYGILDVDDTMLNKRLYYEIGSKGESKTYDVSGGGNAGDGGGAGNIALVSIGAGGGYSAVYLLDKNETIATDPETAPTSPDPVNNNKDNTAKVLMIAGGGGGGAAGANGFHLTALILKMHGDGGDGGSAKSSIIATPNIGNFTTGTYYAGEDGTSSGGKTSYVGQGGTDKPEGLAKTTIGFMTASTYANDWQRTYHQELRRGVGGAGNLHGGGGGAGFAGGGGGIQNVILDANNVGGGGGGSSYLAENTAANHFYPLNTHDDYGNIESSDYFVDKGDNTNAETGGAIVIRYLEDSHYYDYLNDVTISGEVSEYFDIVSANTKCENNINGTVNVLDSTADSEGRYFTVSGNNISFRGSLEPQGKGLTMGQPKNTLTLTLRLKPKATFAGGNDVPIFNYSNDTEKMVFTCTSGSGADTKTCTFITDNTNDENRDNDYKVSHVNVPYCYKVEANSFTWDKVTAENNGTPYSAANIIKSADTSPNAFTDSIAPVYVAYEKQSTEVTAAQYEADAGTKGVYRYDVVLEVTPLTAGNNSVGTANTNPTILRAKSVVEVIDGTPIDGFTVKAKKSLVYNTTDDTYDFTVDLDIDSQNETNSSFYVIDPKASDSLTRTSATNHNSEHAKNNNRTATRENVTDTVKFLGGYYLVEIWGADGGTGAPYDSWINTSALGGAGGKGAFNSAYIYVPSETSITVDLGIRGYNGILYAGHAWDPNSDQEALGGGATVVTVGQNQLIAGGGGGGTPRYRSGSVLDRTGEPDNSPLIGYDGNDPNHTRTDGGYDGKPSVVNSTTSVTPGDGGNNALIGNDFIQNYEDIPYSVRQVLVYAGPDETNKPTGGAEGNGALRITKLGVKGGYGENDDPITIAESVTDFKNSHTAYYDIFKEYLKNFTLTENFSQCFDVENSVVTSSGEAAVTYTKGSQSISFDIDLNDSTLHSESPSDSDYYPIPNNNVIKTQRHDYSYSANGSVKITVKLKPKGNLVGGNDIPLLDEPTNTAADGSTAVDLYHTGTTSTDPPDDRIYLPLNNGTDYANVEIDEDAFSLTGLPQEVVVDYGQSAAINAGIEYGSGKNHNFVTESVSVAPSELTKDGTYTVVGTVESAEAQKAVEIPSVEPKHKSGQVDVRIKYTVNKSLDDLHQVSVEYLDEGETTTMTIGGNVSLASDKDSFTVNDIHDAYVLTIEPDTYYDLPADTGVTVTYDGAEAVMAADVTKKDGKIIITIPSSAFTNNITISASGIENRTPHYVHFLYSVYDEIGGFQTYEEVLTENGVKKPFYSGAELDGITFPFAPNEYPDGYDDYLWEWSVEASNGHYYMGDKDVYIMGNYVPTTYTLIIDYVAADPNDTDFVAPPQYTSPGQSNYNEATGASDIAITKGAEFSIKSPEVDGYTPSQLYYSGTADDMFLGQFDNNKEFTVTIEYTKDPSQLKIYRIICDDYGITVPGDEGTLVSEAAATWNGYDRFKITKWDIVDTKSGKKGEVEVDSISGDGTYYAYYKPHHEQIPINFNKVDPKVLTAKPDEGKVTLPNNRMTYVYEGLEFCYFDTANDKYVNLPTPVCSDHWLFDGWYTAGGQLITDETTVKSEYVDSETHNIELYAHWQKDEFTISVDYRYALNAVTPAGFDPGDLINTADITSGSKSNQNSVTLRYNMGYSFTSPPVDGYSLVNDKEAVIKGNATKDEYFKVLYLNNNSELTPTFTLTINVYSETYNDGSDNPILDARKLQGGTFALYQNGTKIEGSERYNENGTIIWSNAETPITADVEYTVCCIDPPTGYGTASVNISSNGGVKNIFLDKSPFQLPMAGSTPLTGYTVCGISTMLLAAFLLFLYVSSKAEENENE